MVKLLESKRIKFPRRKRFSDLYSSVNLSFEESSTFSKSSIFSRFSRSSRRSRSSRFSRSSTTSSLRSNWSCSTRAPSEVCFSVKDLGNDSCHSDVLASCAEKQPRKLVIQIEFGHSSSASKVQKKNVSVCVEKTFKTYQDRILQQGKGIMDSDEEERDDNSTRVKMNAIPEDGELFLDNFLSNRRNGRQKRKSKERKDSFTHLVEIPKEIDAAKAVSAITNYVPAFRCLHRVSRHPVHAGDRVLVTAANSSIGRATISLALLAGASVFASASEKHHETLLALGAIPLTRSSRKWPPDISDSIDIIIDNGNIRSHACQLALKKGTGSLVRMLENQTRNSNPSSLRSNRYHCFKYDIFRDMEEDTTGFRWDLQSVLEILKEGMIDPMTSKNIPIFGVDYAEICIKRTIEQCTKKL